MKNKAVSSYVTFAIILFILLLVALALYGSALWQMTQNQLVKALLK